MKIVRPLILLTASLSAMAAQPKLLPVRHIRLERARNIAMVPEERLEFAL